jgi:hypothetical protein
MEYRQTLLLLVFFTLSCTGELKPRQTHVDKSDGNLKILQDQKSANEQSEIKGLEKLNQVQSVELRLKKSEEWLLQNGIHYNLSFSEAYLELSRFCLAQWDQAKKLETFRSFIDLIWDEKLELKINSNVLTGISLKNLVITASDPSLGQPLTQALRLKMLLTYRKLMGQTLNDGDLRHLQNQLGLISEDLSFKSLKENHVWRKIHKEISFLLADNKTASHGSQTNFSEKILKEEPLSPAERVKYIKYAIRAKKPLDPGLTANTVAAIAKYSEQYQQISKSLKYFPSSISLKKIDSPTTLPLFFSILNGDLNFADIEILLREGLLREDLMLKDFDDFLNFEVSKIILLFKEDFEKFSARMKSIEPKHYFKEFRQLTSETQISSREIISKFRKFVSIARLLKSEAHARRIENLDLFFKRFLTSNSTLILLHLFRKEGLNLSDDIKLNSMVIKKNSSIDVKVDISLTNVLFLSDNFYLGNLPDQFGFGLTDRMLQKYEILDGIEEGFRLGLFKDLGLDPTDVVRSVIGWMTTSRSVRLNVWRKGQFQETKFYELHQRLLQRQNSPEWQEFMNFCGGWKKHSPIKRTFTVDDIRSSLSIGNLVDNLLDNSSILESREAKITGLFPYNGEVSKVLEGIRSGDLHALVYIETLIGFLKVAGDPTEPLEREVQTFRKNISLFLNDFLSITEKFDECFFLARKQEEEQLRKVFEYEFQYWNQVAIAVDKKATLSSTELFKLDYTPAQGLQYRSSVNNGVLSLVEFDFYFRLKQYFKFGLTIEGKHLPALDPQLDFPMDPELAHSSIYKEIAIQAVDLKGRTPENRVRRIFYAHEFGSERTVKWFQANSLLPSKYLEILKTSNILYRMKDALKDVFKVASKINLPVLASKQLEVSQVFHLSNEMASWYDLLNISNYAPIHDLKNWGLILIDDVTPRPLYDPMVIDLSAQLMSVYGTSSYLGTLDQSPPSNTPPIPKELITIESLSIDLEKYFEEAYISPFRRHKLEFANHFALFSAEATMGKEILEFLETVEKQNPKKSIPIRLKPNRIVHLPLISEQLKVNLKNKLAEMQRKELKIRAAQKQAF